MCDGSTLAHMLLDFTHLRMLMGNGLEKAAAKFSHCCLRLLHVQWHYRQYECRQLHESQQRLDAWP
jgi:hypothetical protein